MDEKGYSGGGCALKGTHLTCLLESEHMAVAQCSPSLFMLIIMLYRLYCHSNGRTTSRPPWRVYFQ
jgi:hypothetical protein